MVADPIDFTMRRRQMAEQALSPAGRTQLSCITGDAKLIKSAIIEDVNAGRCERRFLNKLLDKTFGDAGRHQKAHHAEHWCWFDLAEWSQLLGVSKQQASNIRKALIDRGIIWHEVTSDGITRVGWNLDLTQWQMGTYGGKREGAGKKSIQVVKAPLSQNPNQVVYELPSSRVSTLDKTPIKSCKHASLNGSNGQTSQDRLIKVTEEEKKKRGNGRARTATLPPDFYLTKNTKAEPEPIIETEISYRAAKHLYALLDEYAPSIRASLPALTLKGLTAWTLEFRKFFKRLEKTPVTPVEVRRVMEAACKDRVKGYWLSHITDASSPARYFCKHFTAISVQFPDPSTMPARASPQVRASNPMPMKSVFDMPDS